MIFLFDVFLKSNGTRKWNQSFVNLIQLTCYLASKNGFLKAIILLIHFCAIIEWSLNNRGGVKLVLNWAPPYSYFPCVDRHSSPHGRSIVRSYVMPFNPPFSRFWGLIRNCSGIIPKTTGQAQFAAHLAACCQCLHETTLCTWGISRKKRIYFNLKKGVN